MGEGGRLNLVNGTPYTWVKMRDHAYRMEHWDFPDEITPGSAADVGMQWRTIHEITDGGKVTYSLQGTGNSFVVQAIAHEGFDLQVCMSSMWLQVRAPNSQ